MNKAKLNMACKFNELQLFVAASTAGGGAVAGEKAAVANFKTVPVVVPSLSAF